MSKYFLCKYDFKFFLGAKGGDTIPASHYLYLTRICGDDDDSHDGDDDDVSDDGDIFSQKSLHETDDV
ncbi:hypothetical protein [Paenibacillus sp. 1-18]|uniref:hypothetical protein n=1 Tax=Paenibacillus sp. 1-18 TaxID=1333846 RepID=UPI0012DDACFE|nr:hypothetical protein [Paenibacillus sp. 1-18]